MFAAYSAEGLATSDVSSDGRSSDRVALAVFGAPAATGSRRISHPVFGRSSANRRAVPSDAIELGHCSLPLVVNRSTGPDPSDATLYRLGGPARFERKTIRRPSGVHLGRWSQLRS